MVMRRGDLVQGEAGERSAHVRQGVDGHADLADLALGARVVGVVAHLGGQVEGARQAGLAGVEQELEPLVGRLGRAEAGVLAHGPQPPAVHGRLHAARIGILTRLTQLNGVVEVLEVRAAIDRLYLDA